MVGGRPFVVPGAGGRRRRLGGAPRRHLRRPDPAGALGLDPSRARPRDVLHRLEHAVADGDPEAAAALAPAGDEAAARPAASRRRQRPGDRGATASRCATSTRSAVSTRRGGGPRRSRPGGGSRASTAPRRWATSSSCSQAGGDRTAIAGIGGTTGLSPVWLTGPVRRGAGAGHPRGGGDRCRPLRPAGRVSRARGAASAAAVALRARRGGADQRRRARRGAGRGAGPVRRDRRRHQRRGRRPRRRRPGPRPGQPRGLRRPRRAGVPGRDEPRGRPRGDGGGHRAGRGPGLADRGVRRLRRAARRRPPAVGHRRPGGAAGAP